MGWDFEAGLRWKIEESNGDQWEYKNSFMMAWKSRFKRDSTKYTIKIPVDQITMYGSRES